MPDRDGVDNKEAASAKTPNKAGKLTELDLNMLDEIYPSHDKTSKNVGKPSIEKEIQQPEEERKTLGKTKTSVGNQSEILDAPDPEDPHLPTSRPKREVIRAWFKHG